MSQYKTTVYPNDKSPKLFKNKILEYLTKTHPLIIDSIYLVITSWMIYNYTKIVQDYTWTFIVLMFFFGVFVWTFAEYLLHRFLYHKIKDASYNSGIQYLFHGIHHEYPNDEERLVLPPVPSLILAAIFFGLFYLLMGVEAYVFSPGFIIGYCLYMTIHYTVHKVSPPKKFNFWWKHHNIHHYQQHDRAFGVSTSLWDRIFFTMPENNRKTITIEVKKN